MDAFTHYLDNFSKKISVSSSVSGRITPDGEVGLCLATKARQSWAASQRQSPMQRC